MKLYVPLDGATLTAGELEETIQRGTVGRGVKLSLLAAAKINGDPWNWGALSTSIGSGGTIDVTTDPAKLTFISGAGAGQDWCGYAQASGDFWIETFVEKPAVTDTATNRYAALFALINSGAFPENFSALAGVYFYNLGHKIAFYSNTGGAEAGPALTVDDFPLRLSIKRVGNVMSGWYMLRTQTTWTQVGTNQTIAALAAPYIAAYVQNAAISAQFTHFRNVGDFYSDASPTAACVSIPCTQEIDPAGAELAQLYRANWWDEALTVGADTDTYAKIRYGVDGGAKSAWYTLEAYKALAAFTPTASVEFDLQANSDGTQEIEAYDFCAGTLGSVAAESSLSESTASESSLSESSLTESSKTSLSESSATESSKTSLSESSATESSKTSLSESSLTESTATTATSASTATTVTTQTSSTSTSSSNDPTWPAEASVLDSEPPYGPTGSEYQGTLSLEAPSRPSLAATVGNGSITATIAGDAAVTNYLYSRETDGSVTLVGSRSGNGNITVSDLDNAEIYEIYAQANSASNVYGPASIVLYRRPRLQTDIPSGHIGKIMNAIYDFFVASPSLLAWIQLYNSDGTTSGRVTLGRSPKSLPNLESGGPIVNIRRGYLRSPNAGSELTFTHELQIIADIAWFEDFRTYCTGIENADWVAKILDELQAIGNDLVAGLGGQFLGIDCDEFDTFDPSERNTTHTEIKMTIWY